MQGQLVRPGFALAICVVATIGGCHHGALEAPGVDRSLPVADGEQLFETALFHARGGDLLRAEQYLSAARHRGYDEADVVYWLIRVCVLAGRYRSALRHATDYLRHQPQNWGLRLVVASIYETLGNRARARVELETIVRAEPSRALPRYSLALLYLEEISLRHRAAIHLEAYLQLDPHGPHASEVEAILAEVLTEMHGFRESIQ